MQTKCIIVLDNIRSAHNVGSIFRTADAAGVSRIFLCGTTPSPVDRFGRKRNDIAKVALGAEETVSWEHVPDTVSLIQNLKKDGVWVVGVEQTPSAQDFRAPAGLHEKIAYVFGAEVGGVSTAALDMCDAVIEIPMAGKKESLNVSVAVGVILFCAAGR